jgi:hypothetical protein
MKTTTSSISSSSKKKRILTPKIIGCSLGGVCLAAGGGIGIGFAIANANHKNNPNTGEITTSIAFNNGNTLNIDTPTNEVVATITCYNAPTNPTGIVFSGEGGLEQSEVI